MTQEEKAKAYDEALKKLRDFYRDYDTISCLIDVKEELANLFPELKESEYEKMRKWIIDDIIYNMNNETLENSEYKKQAQKALAWLEKQGKPKWNEEDEKILMHIIQDVELLLGDEDERFKDERRQSLVWLKSLKQRMEKQ